MNQDLANCCSLLDGTGPLSKIFTEPFRFLYRTYNIHIYSHVEQLLQKGSDLWRLDQRLPSTSMPIDDESLSSGHAIGAVVEMDAPGKGSHHSSKDKFFKVTDHPKSLSSMSLLGETSNRAVDLFAQIFTALRELDDSSVLVFAQTGIVVVTCS